MQAKFMAKAIDYVTVDRSLRISYSSGSYPSTSVTSRTTGAFTWGSLGLSLKEGFGRDGDHGTEIFFIGPAMSALLKLLLDQRGCPGQLGLCFCPYGSEAVNSSTPMWPKPAPSSVVTRTRSSPCAVAGTLGRMAVRKMFWLTSRRAETFSMR
jgi:hypothetical protein